MNIAPGETAVIQYDHPDGSKSFVSVKGQADSIRVDVTTPEGKAFNIGYPAGETINIGGGGGHLSKPSITVYPT